MSRSATKSVSRKWSLAKRTSVLTSTSEKRDIDKTNYRFSLSRALDAARQNKVLEGAEAEWMQEAHREMRHMGLTSRAPSLSHPSLWRCVTKLTTSPQTEQRQVA